MGDVIVQEGEVHFGGTHLPLLLKTKPGLHSQPQFADFLILGPQLIPAGQPHLTVESVLLPSGQVH